MANPEGSSRGSRWSLKGTNALVTGGTRGIGYVIFSSFFFFSGFYLLRELNWVSWFWGLLKWLKVSFFAWCVFWVWFTSLLIQARCGGGTSGVWCHSVHLFQEWIRVECMLEGVEQKGFSVSGLVCDASSPPHRENLIQQVASAFNGKLNILVSLFLFLHVWKLEYFVLNFFV